MTEEQIAWMTAKLIEASYFGDIANDNNNVSDADYMEGLVDAYAGTFAKLAPEAAKAVEEKITEHRNNKWEGYKPADERPAE